MSDNEFFSLLDSEEPDEMATYGTRTPLQISLNINRIIASRVMQNPVARGVDAAMTVEWTRTIMQNMTDDHVAALSEKRWVNSSMPDKLHLMEVYRSVIEEMRPDGTIIDESQQELWTWNNLVSGAGTLMRLINFMIRKATSQGGGGSSSRDLKDKVLDWGSLLMDGLPVPPGSLSRRRGNNGNCLLASGIKSIETVTPGWWANVKTQIPKQTNSMSQEAWDKHLIKVAREAVWDDSLVEKGADEGDVYAGRFNVDWLVNLAYFCRRYGHTFLRLEPLTRFLNVMSRTGPLTKAKLVSAEGHYPILTEMETQWVGDGNKLHMCPVATTFRRFNLTISLLCGYPSELTAFRCISDLDELAWFIDVVFQAQGGIESLLPGPEDTSLAEYMLHRALIWSHDTDPAKFVRTNILQVMSGIVSDDDDGGEGANEP